MFLGCSAATAVLAAEFASTRVPVRRHADDAEETDLGPLKCVACGSRGTSVYGLHEFPIAEGPAQHAADYLEAACH